MKILTKEQISSFSAFLDAHKCFIVVGHKDPDGDCISSSIVISKIIESINKVSMLISSGPFKRTEIKQYEKLFTSQIPFMTQIEQKECGLILVDCSEISRLGDVGDVSSLDVFIIDHHKTTIESNTKNCILDSSSPATACIAQMLYENIIGKPSAQIAKIMFFGLCTDTGFFRFLRTDSAEVFELAARLVRYGANPQEMFDTISAGKPYSTRKLLGVVLDHTERCCGGKVIITYETMSDTKKYGLDGRDSDMLYQILLATEGVEAVAFVREETEHSCTAGFRSRAEVDVSKIASHFGGGGHKNASGMSVEGKLDTLLPAIKKEFERAFQNKDKA